MAKTGQDLLNEVRGDLNEYTESVYRDTDLLTWLNKGLTRLALKVREQREGWLSTTISTTDSSLIIKGQTYVPSTSLACTSGATTITLPPDCIEVVSILPASQELLDRGVSFIKSKPTNAEFVALQRMNPPFITGSWSYYYILRGKRTLQVAPAFMETFNITLLYDALPADVTVGDTVDELFDELLDACVLYTVYRALKSIGHVDTQKAFGYFKEELNDLLSLTRPRSSQNAQVAEGAWDHLDTYSRYDTVW